MSYVSKYHYFRYLLLISYILLHLAYLEKPLLTAAKLLTLYAFTCYLYTYKTNTKRLFSLFIAYFHYIQSVLFC